MKNNEIIKDKNSITQFEHFQGFHLVFGQFKEAFTKFEISSEYWLRTDDICTNKICSKELRSLYDALYDYVLTKMSNGYNIFFNPYAHIRFDYHTHYTCIGEDLNFCEPVFKIWEWGSENLVKCIRDWNPTDEERKMLTKTLSEDIHKKLEMLHNITRLKIKMVPDKFGSRGIDHLSKEITYSMSIAGGYESAETATIVSTLIDLAENYIKLGNDTKLDTRKLYIEYETWTHNVSFALNGSSDECIIYSDKWMNPGNEFKKTITQMIIRDYC